MQLAQCGTRMHQRSMATHQQHQGASNIHGKQWHQNRSHKAPHDKRMPFPLPNFVNQAQRMMAQMLDLLSVKREAASVKEMNAQFNKRNKQK
jgi:hypothetical protein